MNLVQAYNNKWTFVQFESKNKPRPILYFSNNTGSRIEMVELTGETIRPTTIAVHYSARSNQ